MCDLLFFGSFSKATGPTPFSIGQHPFSIGNAMGVSQFTMPPLVTPAGESSPTPPTGGDLPSFRHGSVAARFSPRNAAPFGGPSGLTPTSSPGPGTRRRHRDRSRDYGRMDG